MADETRALGEPGGAGGGARRIWDHVLLRLLVYYTAFFAVALTVGTVFPQIPEALSRERARHVMAVVPTGVAAEQATPEASVEPAADESSDEPAEAASDESADEATDESEEDEA